MRDRVPTPDECFTRAAATLDVAGFTLDREMMDKLDSIACSWMALGRMLLDRDDPDSVTL